MDGNLLLVPAVKKWKNRRFVQRKHPFPIFSNETQKTGPGDSVKYKCYIGHLEFNCVIINDNETIKSLFSMGFFGKGTLSRSTPRVCLETPRKKSETTGATENDSSDSASEMEIETIEINQNKEKEAAKDIPSKEGEDSSERKSPEVEIEVTSEPEELQLTFEEAFFLSYGLGCLVVMDKNQPMDLQRLWQKFCDLSTDIQFPIMYTAYHHFRSKGWIVRSGIKYGSDFVLYKDGPPYYHSTYAVIVKAVKEKHLKETYHNDRLQLTWPSLIAANRVVTHAAKGLMFLYVIKPEMMSENKILTPFCVSRFKLQEVLVKRWVPSSGREDDG